jgi:hypothetical protein
MSTTKLADALPPLPDVELAEIRNDSINKTRLSETGAHYWGSNWREVRKLYTAEQMHAYAVAAVAQAEAKPAPAQWADELARERLLRGSAERQLEHCRDQLARARNDARRELLDQGWVRRQDPSAPAAPAPEQQAEPYTYERQKAAFEVWAKRLGLRLDRWRIHPDFCDQAEAETWAAWQAWKDSPGHCVD